MRFAEALSQPGFGTIAEFKRRSPSAGDISPGARVEDIVPAYEAGGARAVSVLVDDAFAGSLDDLRAARASIGLPLLAKGFFSTDDDLRTAKEAGADAVLLLLRDLDDGETARLMGVAEELGLEPTDPEVLRGGSAVENAVIVRAVLTGEPGGRRDAVLLNAAGALVAAGLADDLMEGIAISSETIDSGAAASRLDALVDFSAEETV